MTPAEAQAFLGENRKVQVATLDATGAPHLSTLFYALVDGLIAFSTYRKSQKSVNLHHDPRISCLVEVGHEYGKLKGVSITGTARLIDEAEYVEELGLLIVDYGERSIRDIQDRIAHQAPRRVAVIVEPNRVATWDHGKL